MFEISGCAVFVFSFVVVVAERSLYTTTSSRLPRALLFGFWVWFGLLFGCEGCGDLRGVLQF